MIMPVLALLNSFLSHLDRGMEWNPSKHRGQTNRARSERPQLSSVVLAKPLCPVSHLPEEKWDPRSGVSSAEGCKDEWGWRPCQLNEAVRTELGREVASQWTSQQPNRAFGGLQQRWVLPEVHSKGMTGNRHKFQQGNVCLVGWKENNSTVDTVKQWKKSSFYRDTQV